MLVPELDPPGLRYEADRRFSACDLRIILSHLGASTVGSRSLSERDLRYRGPCGRALQAVEAQLETPYEWGRGSRRAEGFRSRPCNVAWARGPYGKLF